MPSRLAIPAALLLGAHLAAAPVAAQAIPAVPDTGARVRVALHDRGRIVGTLVAREPGRWVVVDARGDSLVFAPRQVDRFEVSGGQRSAGDAFWSGAGRGALVGGGITLGALFVLGASGNLECGDCFFPPALVVGVGGAMLTVGTTLVGGIVGQATRDRWVRVRMPDDAGLTLVPVRDGAALVVRLPVPR